MRSLLVLSLLLTACTTVPNKPLTPAERAQIEADQRESLKHIHEDRSDSYMRR